MLTLRFLRRSAREGLFSESERLFWERRASKATMDGRLQTRIEIEAHTTEAVDVVYESRSVMRQSSGARCLAILA